MAEIEHEPAILSELFLFSNLNIRAVVFINFWNEENAFIQSSEKGCSIMAFEVLSYFYWVVDFLVGLQRIWVFKKFWSIPFTIRWKISTPNSMSIGTGQSKDESTGWTFLRSVEISGLLQCYIVFVMSAMEVKYAPRSKDLQKVRQDYDKDVMRR